MPSASPTIPSATGCRKAEGAIQRHAFLARLSLEVEAVRLGVAVRGLRPSLAEIDAVRADPDALPQLVDDWLAADAFGQTVKDMHAELFLLRADTAYQLPVKGILEERGYNQADLHFSTVEAPLEKVFPASDRARDVRDALERWSRQAGGVWAGPR